MPAGLNIELYLNLMFLFIVGFAALMGFMRGTVKSIYYLIVKAVFVGIFFLTINVVVNQLWTMQLPGLDMIGQFMPELAGATTLEQALPLLLESLLGENLEASLTNEELIAFVTGLALFIVKIVYTILYFTVFSFVYKFITFIIRIIVVRPGKPSMSGRLIGAGVGAVNGLLSVFITLIVLGGLMSINESVVTIAESALNSSATLHQTAPEYGAVVPLSLQENRLNELNPNVSNFEAFPMNTNEPNLDDLDEQISMLREIIDAYNSNYFVVMFGVISVKDEQTNQEIPLNLVLFDSVFSFNYRENQISFRKELSIIGQMANVILESDYMESNNLSDLTGSEIEEVFTILSYSDLFISLIPLAIEMGADYMETEIDIPREELYAIDWEHEVRQLGLIAAMTFELINKAGLLEDESDLETITLEGDEVRDIFDAFSESDLITRAIGIAAELFLDGNDNLSAIITVPADISWSEEFKAMGEVVGEIVDTGITVGDLQSGDFMILLTGLSNMDFEVLYQSKIVSHALVNILSGRAGFEGLDMIIVTDDVTWFDEGETPGELRNILRALNRVAQIAASIGDFNEISLNLVFELDDEALDDLLNSKVLAATVGALIIDNLGDELTVPHTAKMTVSVNGGSREVVTPQEIKDVFKAISLLQVVDLENLDFDFGLLSVLGLDEDPTVLDPEKADRLFASNIIWATLSTLLFDTMDDNDVITIPYKNMSNEDIRVLDLVDNIEYITREELTAILEAILVLDLENFDNFESLDLGLIKDNIQTLLGSAILHATISEQLLSMMNNDTVVVPYFDQYNEEIRLLIGDPGFETEYILDTELIALLDALDVLGLTDIDSFSGDFGIETLLEEGNLDVLLESAIIHATVSDILLDQAIEGNIQVPQVDQVGDDVRIIRGVGVQATEYILKTELQALIDALDVLGLTDLNSFDGSLDLSVLAVDDNTDKVLESAIIHATVSNKIIELAGNGTVIVPFLEEDDTTQVRLTVGPVDAETEYIIKSEIKDMIIALDILGILDVESFGGTLDLSVLAIDNNAEIVLRSSILQATISDQIFDLAANDTVTVPYFAEDGVTEIRITVGTLDTETRYITKAELEAVIIALDILDILDVQNFTGTIDLSVLVIDDNLEKVLTSSILQATISQKVFDLDDSDTIVVPYFRDDDVTEVRITVGTLDTETTYISKAELETMIIALDILDVLDVESFTGTIDLSVLAQAYQAGPTTNANEALKSAIIQATMSKKVLDLHVNETVIVPARESDLTTLVRVTVGSGSESTEYITSLELENMILALDILGILDVEGYTGEIDLTVIYDLENRTQLLSSAIMHATISKQLFDLNTSNTLTIPYTYDLGSGLFDIRVNDDYLTIEVDFVIKDEIHAIVEVMELFGITSVSGFTGSFDLTVLNTPESKDTLLSSASMHATISKTLFDLGDQVLIIPLESQPVLGDSIDVRFYIGNIGEDFEYVLDDEIKALIDALLAMGYSDLDSFGGGIELDRFFDEKETILLSHAIHATVSYNMLNKTGGALVVPNKDALDEFIRIETLGSIIYIEKDEVLAILNGLEELGFTDFSNIDVNPSNLLTKDFEQIINSSVSLQATISKAILDIALDETAAIGSSTLIVPTTLREGIEVDLDNLEQIERLELIQLLEGLQVLNISNFGDAINPEIITSLSDEDLDALLDSGSIHTTLDNMLKGNNNISIPNLADEIYYDLAFEITTKDEVKAFIKAVSTLGQTSFTTASFDLNDIANLDETERSIIFDSMIVRNTIQPQVDNAVDAHVLLNDPTYEVDDTYYHEDDPNLFLTKQGLINVLTEIGLIS